MKTTVLYTALGVSVAAILLTLTAACCCWVACPCGAARPQDPSCCEGKLPCDKAKCDCDCADGVPCKCAVRKPCDAAGREP